MLPETNHSSVVRQKFFEDFLIGDTATLTRSFTRKDVDAYGDLLGDHNPIHFDEEFAKKMGFKSCLVHGMMTAGLALTIAGMKLPGPGAILPRNSFEWEKPVYIGDEVTMKATVAELHRWGRLGRVVLLIEGFVNEEVVMTGSMTLCVPYKEAAA